MGGKGFSDADFLSYACMHASDAAAIASNGWKILLRCRPWCLLTHRSQTGPIITSNRSCIVWRGKGGIGI